MNRITNTTMCLLLGLLVTCGDRLSGSASAADDGIGVYRDPTGRVVYNRTVMDSTAYGQRNVPFGPRYRVYNLIGSGQGFNGGNTFVSAFMPYHINPWTDLLFFDGRAAVSYDGEGDVAVLNGGIGYRRYIEPWQKIVGASAWIDFDTAHQESVTQYGVSAEFIDMKSGLEVRANGYLAADSDQTKGLFTGIGGLPYFRGHYIMLPRLNITQHQYEGVDAELGGPLPYWGRFGINAYVGGYWLQSDGLKDATGVQARWEAFLHEDIQVGMQFRNDRVFGTSAWGTVMFQIPRTWRGWWRQKWIRKRNLVDQLSRQVERYYRIPVKVRKHLDPERLIDPRDGNPIYVLHVNPRGAGGGDGSYETPFNSGNFKNHDYADIIYVLPGHFVRPGTLHLFDNQRLLAANHQHFVISAQGTFPLPVVSGANPVILNTAGQDVIALANNNEVSGFDINGMGAGVGIVGANIVDFNLNRLTVFNSTDGIQITNYGQSGLAPPFGQPNTIIDVTASGNLQNGVSLAMNNGGEGTVLIDRLNSGANNLNGLAVTNTGDSTTNLMLISSTLGGGSGLSGNGADGFNVTADSGFINLVIGGPNEADGNLFAANGDQGLDFDLSGTAVTTIDARNNIVGSGGDTGSVTFGLNFTASLFGGPNTSGVPPDTMGSVGPGHIVEFINTQFTVFDKATGATLQTTSLDQFWTDAGVTVPAGDGTFDPRIIYDTQTGRWFAVAIDGLSGTGVGNRIYVAVSKTSNPTQGWNGFQFVGDVTGMRFNDFDTFGIDANGLYIATNNFMGGTTFTDVSMYVIPKKDLLGATPTIGNLKRFENLSPGMTGFAPQAVVNLEGASGNHPFLAVPVNMPANTIIRTDATGAGTGTVTLSSSSNIQVPTFSAPPLGRQPGPADNIETGDGRFSSNIVQVGNSLWAAHAVRDPATGASVIRWYEFDKTTNTLKQTGIIREPLLDLDLYYPSIAVNKAGNVVVGFSGSREGTSISTYAAIGRTVNGVTTFGDPTRLKQGTGTYSLVAGGRNRWGDYSATVADPLDSSTFWTFQEFVNSDDVWGTQITQLKLGAPGNTNDGWRINLRNTAVLRPSTFDHNKFLNNGGVGLNITANDASVVQNAIITNNTFSGNMTGLMLTANDMAVINSVVNNNKSAGNLGMNTGFHFLANGGTLNIAELRSNLATSNINGNGFRLEATSGGLLTVANGTGNSSDGNGLNGMLISANGMGSRIFGSMGNPGEPGNVFADNGLNDLLIEELAGGIVRGPDGMSPFTYILAPVGSLFP